MEEFEDLFVFAENTGFHISFACYKNYLLEEGDSLQSASSSDGRKIELAGNQHSLLLERSRTLLWYRNISLLPPPPPHRLIHKIGLWHVHSKTMMGNGWAALSLHYFSANRC